MVTIITSISSGNNAIGNKGSLIYKIPEDLKRFREITTGHPIIMGRKTFDSIGRILPNRTNIVISRDGNLKIEGAKIANSIEKALEIAKNSEGSDQIFIIGGAQIFAQALPFTDKLDLTVIEGSPEADAFFPYYSEFKKVTFEENHEFNGLKYKYLNLEK